MARGLLISFAGFPVTASSLFPDNGLASLAGVLLAHGHEVKILDYNTVSTVKRMISPELSSRLAGFLPHLAAEPSQELISSLLELDRVMEEELVRVSCQLADELKDRIAREKVHWVGFKLWSGRGFLVSVLIAESLRRSLPEVKRFAGGPAVLYAEEAIFSITDAFDVLVDGEGEEAILGLAAFAEGKGDLRTVPNLIVKEGEVIRRTHRSFVRDLEDLPQAAYGPDCYPSLAHNEQIKVLILDESRGCPSGCHFCIHRHASGRNWRTKSPNRALEDAANFSGLHGSYTFRFGGSSTPLSFYKQFGELARSSGLPLRFSGFAFPQRAFAGCFDLLASGGCKSLFFGVESFCERDRAVLGKKLSRPSAVHVLQRCMDHGIVPGISLIEPLPGQTAQERRTNLQITVELFRQREATVMVSFPALLPRTAWWSDRSKYGFELMIDEKDYRRLLASYKIRQIIPPQFWEPVPYTLDGMSFRDYTQISFDFQRALMDQGIPVNVQDEVVLLSDALEVSIQDLKKRLTRLFFTMDPSELETFVLDANDKLCCDRLP